MTDKVVRNWTVWGYNAEQDKYGDWPTGVEVLWEVGEAGYEWEHFALVRRPHGDTYQYAAYTDSGCSCNSAMDMHPDRYELSWSFEKTEPRAALHKALKDNSYFLNDGQKTKARASLRRA